MGERRDLRPRAVPARAFFTDQQHRLTSLLQVLDTLHLWASTPQIDVKEGAMLCGHQDAVSAGIRRTRILGQRFVLPILPAAQYDPTILETAVAFSQHAERIGEIAAT
jgi:hypothetical protein